MNTRNLVFVLGCYLCFTLSNAQEVNVLTYNIKYDNVSDTVNNWNDRKASMVKLLEHYKPSIIGMQEVLDNQLVYLNENLPNYAAIGVGREDGKKKGEYSPILFDTTQYNLLQSETFWLSETPEKISVGWDAALERICTYGLFEDVKTKKQFWVFNTHFDHRGDLAREKSAELIVSKIKSINTKGYPVALMGDLNLYPDQKPIQYLKKQLTDGQTVTQQAIYGPTGTFNGFDPNKILDGRIDYIFVEGFKVESYTHIDDRMENNKHISDHLPVLAKLEME
ncbi:endonuclease/exonuclease/phosphatase family protein [Maribacter sp. X9]|uniref:endonuclease/exonuclease/phosphatase family protein n=1 Tax=Maribacter sp. X9 TaxID=3402159 RepID=UPI003AF3EEA3